MVVLRRFRTAFLLALAAVAAGVLAALAASGEEWPKPAAVRSSASKPTSSAPTGPPRFAQPNSKRPAEPAGLSSLKQKVTLATRQQGSGPLSDDSSGSPESVPRGTRIAPAISPLTLEDLEGIALQNNPSLAQAQGYVAAARGNLVQVGLPPNMELGYSGQQLGSHGVAEQQGVYMAQQFITGGKLKLNRAVAVQEVSRAEQILIAQRFRVLTDVQMGYYDVLTAQRQLALTQELVGIGEKAVGVAEALLKAKEGSRVDLLQAKIELDTAKIQLERSRNLQASAWRSLTAVLGTPEFAPQTLRGDLESGVPEITWEEALGNLMSQSPEVLAALADVDRARFAVQRARREAVPNISVQGIVQHDQQIQSSDGAIQASMPLPLWNRNQGGILLAEGELTAALRSVDRIELQLQRRLAPVFQRYATARHQAQRYSQDILPNAESSLELVREGYRAGEFGFLNLLVAQRTYSQTNLAYIESLRELWSLAVEIRGLLLSDSLQGPQQGR